MNTFLKKNVTTFLILIATLVLAGIAIFTAIRLYQLRNQAVSPNAPSSKPAAAEPTTYTKTQTVIIPKITSNCPYGQGDNGTKSGNANAIAARNESDQQFSVDSACTLSSAKITTSGLPTGNTLFKGWPVITIDNNTVIGNSNVITKLGGIGKPFVWTGIRFNSTTNNTKFPTNINPLYTCSGSPCDFPAFKKLLPAVEIDLTNTQFSSLLSTGDTHKFGLIVMGSNGNDQCNFYNDLKLTLTYSCPNTVISCTEATFTIQTPTPTAVPTDTPTPTATATTEASSTPTATPTTAPLSCNGVCTDNSQCSDGMICSSGRCRNNSCREQTDCSCPGSTNTPTPTGTPRGTATPRPSGTATPAPQLPNAGVSTPTLVGGAMGILLLVGAILLAI